MTSAIAKDANSATLSHPRTLRKLCTCRNVLLFPPALVTYRKSCLWYSLPSSSSSLTWLKISIMYQASSDSESIHVVCSVSEALSDMTSAKARQKRGKYVIPLNKTTNKFSLGSILAKAARSEKIYKTTKAAMKGKNM